MARYTRKTPAPVQADYRKYRADVRADFRTECAHCLVIELHAAGAEAMKLDHFRPQRLFPALRSDYGNIYYACEPCNRFKWHCWPDASLSAKGYGFVDLCQDDARTHYGLNARNELVPLTNAADYTIRKCRLNRPHLCTLRGMLIAQGRYAL